MKSTIKNKILHCFGLLLAIGILLFKSCEPAFAQDATTNAPANPVAGVTNLESGFAFASSVTNIVVIPYLKYNVNADSFGYGVAGLYRVSDNFWTGLRVDRIDGQQTTAGAQAQLQTTLSYRSLKFTPFIEASVGLGSSSVYASAGPGAFANFYSHSWSSGMQFDVGIVADYEHVVNGSENSNQLNVGPLIHFSF